MTAITDPRLARLRDLTFSPKGEATQWAHEFDAELRAVQDDLTTLAESVVRYETTAAGEQLLTDLTADQPDPVEQPPPAADEDPDARPNAAEAEAVRRELVSAAADAAEIDRLRRLLQIEQDARRNALPLERFARAAYSIARAIDCADEDGYWLPAEYLSEQFSALVRLGRALSPSLEQ